MDIFGILDPDPHENLCGSETLFSTYKVQSNKFDYCYVKNKLDQYWCGAGTDLIHTVSML